MHKIEYTPQEIAATLLDPNRVNINGTVLDIFPKGCNQEWKDSIIQWQKRVCQFEPVYKDIDEIKDTKTLPYSTVLLAPDFFCEDEAIMDVYNKMPKGSTLLCIISAVKGIPDYMLTWLRHEDSMWQMVYDTTRHQTLILLSIKKKEDVLR